MARMNIEGSEMMGELCERLNVEYKQIGSLVLAFGENELAVVRELFERGTENKVKGLQILTKEQTLNLEPNLNTDVYGALYAPTAAIINPWGLCLALAQTAVKNGAELHLNSEVTGIERKDGYFYIQTTKGGFEARYIVNASGAHADKISAMAVKPFFKIVPIKGEYYLLDKSQGEKVQRVVFQTPNESGKGVLIAPTVHGNLIVGPTSQQVSDPEDTSVTSMGLEKVINTSMQSSNKVDFKESIRNFAGIRATAETDDFIIEASAPGFINAAAIKSPGLSSAPAIALEVVKLLEENGLQIRVKEKFEICRNEIFFKDMTPEEQQSALERDKHYGRVICRCETITEGDILAVLKSPIPPVSLDGVKRRCRTGSGRCQGGFCGPRVHEILSREQGQKMENVCQDIAGSFLLTGKTKEGGNA
jgi:glycerol-3-phosphate dehydrogenase